MTETTTAPAADLPHAVLTIGAHPSRGPNACPKCPGARVTDTPVVDANSGVPLTGRRCPDCEQAWYTYDQWVAAGRPSALRGGASGPYLNTALAALLFGPPKATTPEATDV